MANGRLVMTEPLAYPVFLGFMLTLCRALESPTLARQLTCIGLLAAAVGTRAQAFAFVPALVSAIVVSGSSAGEIRVTLRRFAPTWATLGLGLAVGLLATRGNPRSLLGSYGVLAHPVSPTELAKWLVWSAATLEIAVVFVPAFAACIVLPRLLARSAQGSERALGSMIASVTVWIVASTTLLSATQFGLGRVHERNLFYLVPPFLICLAYWIEHERLVAWKIAIPALVVVAVLPMTLPYRLIGGASPFDGPSMLPWANLHARLGSLPTGVAIGLVGLAAIAWSVFSRYSVVSVLVVVVGLYAVIAQQTALPLPSGSTTERSAWIDKALPRSAGVTILYVDQARGCPEARTREPTLRSIEFVNKAVDRVFYLFGPDVQRGLPGTPLRITGGGSLVHAGRPVRPTYVVTQATVRLVGTRMASSELTPQSGLTLWRTSRPLRLANPWAVVARGGTVVSCSLR